MPLCSTARTSAAKSAGIKHIDYLVITHYHTDHAGGVPQLVAMVREVTLTRCEQTPADPLGSRRDAVSLTSSITYDCACANVMWV